MKKLSILTAGILMVFSLAIVTFYTSCTDPCKDVKCLNAGTCVDGTCNCASGYEGDDCGTEIRAKFKGPWTAADGCSLSGSASYGVSVSSGTGIFDVKITNVWNSFVNSVNATVSGTTITILTQEPDNDGFTVSGTGTINAAGNSITWSYTVTDSGSGLSDVCTSTWTN